MTRLGGCLPKKCFDSFEHILSPKQVSDFIDYRRKTLRLSFYYYGYIHTLVRLPEYQQRNPRIIKAYGGFSLILRHDSERRVIMDTRRIMLLLQAEVLLLVGVIGYLLSDYVASAILRDEYQFSEMDRLMLDDDEVDPEEVELAGQTYAEAMEGRRIMNYNEISKPDFPEDDDEYDDDEEEDVKLFQNVISPDAFERNLEDYEQYQFTYYVDDDILLNSVELIVKHNRREMMMGPDFMDNFGVLCDDENMVYIANDKLKQHYKITRIPDSYARAVQWYGHCLMSPRRHSGVSRSTVDEDYFRWLVNIVKDGRHPSRQFLMAPTSQTHFYLDSSQRR